MHCLFVSTAMNQASGRSTASVPIQDAMNQSSVISGLATAIRQSQQQMQRITPLLPAMLAREIRPGPIDATTWCLLVPNGAVATKLRQLLPTIETELRLAHGPNYSVRIKVLAR
jgi:hypothetical protein